MTGRSVATAVAAVLGIAVSASLAWAASQLAGQRVGLSSEPLAVATALAPHVPSTPARTSTRHGDDRSSTARRPPPAVSRPSAAQSPARSTATPPPTTIPTGPATHPALRHGSGDPTFPEHRPHRAFLCPLDGECAPCRASRGRRRPARRLSHG